MSVGEICNREVIVVTGATGIGEAARLMRQYHVGDLVVVEEHEGRRTPVGIVTDRDLVVEVLAQEVVPAGLTVADIMSGELVIAREDDDLLDILAEMRAAGVRRVPVVDAGGLLLGILTVDDLLDLLAEGMVELVRLVTREQRREQHERP